MRDAGVALVALLAGALVLPAAPADATPGPPGASGVPGAAVAFEPPAQLGPGLAVAGSQWLLLVFSGSTPASGALAFAGPQAGEEFLEAGVRPDAPGAGEPASAPAGSVREDVPAFEAALGFGRGPASLYLEAASITWSVAGSGMGLELWQDPACLQAVVGTGPTRDRSGRYEEMCPGATVALRSDGAAAAPLALSVQADGITRAELHNADLRCADGAGGGDAGAACPGGGRRDEESNGAGGVGATRRLLSFASLTGPGDGRLELAGLAAAVAGGGDSLDVAVAGEARLPRASGGFGEDGQTLRLRGNFTLAGLAEAPGGGLAARLEGDLEGARLDEAAIDPASVLGVGALAAGVAATVGLAWLAKALLATLFTKMRPELALLNENRRTVYEYIRQRPGTTLRETMRGTGLAGGPVRNHIRRLKESGHIVERPHGASRRFFPAGAATEADLSRAILLREPPLRELFEMVQRNPWLAQGDYMDLGARDMGWSRSTTQYRLGRLVKGGLVTVRKEGRFRLHATVEP